MRTARAATPSRFKEAVKKDTNKKQVVSWNRGWEKDATTALLKRVASAPVEKDNLNYYRKTVWLGGSWGSASQSIRLQAKRAAEKELERRAKPRAGLAGHGKSVNPRVRSKR